MLMNLQPSPYDVNFRLFSIPTRVHPSFWLIAALFSFDLARSGMLYWGIGIGCIFFSILIHELGHALLYRCYHMGSYILIYSFGGLTISHDRLPVRSWRIIVSLAGPLANFLVVGIVWSTNEIEPWRLTSDATKVIYSLLYIVNLFLGIVNLLPVYPLDGGQISRELWTAQQPRRGLINSLRMSFIVAIAFVAYALGCHFNAIPRDWIPLDLRPGLFTAIIFGLIAVENYTELQNNMRSHDFRYYDR